ncbi:repeat domain-containing 23-like [Octopus vulgaris]|uniref:Repeat domain-containing 23-like n=2 Tax=Octopus TaxID=6643 RepID=A0AA36EVR7_OCTVU|nr:ankyrin repeat domain-containing protein 23-like [Octopus sinensis]CAI9715084.1 repeat domain-containing 23-like [Octopus vulgaris]
MKKINVKKFPPSAKFLAEDSRPHIITAVSNGNIAVVRKLLRAGIDPNTRDEKNQSLISLASRAGNLAMVDELLQWGAKVNASTSDGCTALHVATEAKHEDIVKRLIDAGASMTATTLSGLKPIDLAKNETPVWYALRKAEEEEKAKAESAGYDQTMTVRKRNSSLRRSS